MKINKYQSAKSGIFNTESVSEGHPDKIADQISELVVDYFVEKDKNSHIACEVMVLDKYIIVGGEIHSKIKFKEEEKKIEKKIIDYLKNEIGYDKKTWPNLFDGSLKIRFIFKEQSKEINKKVITKIEKFKVIPLRYRKIISELLNKWKNEKKQKDFFEKQNKILYDKIEKLEKEIEELKERNWKIRKQYDEK